METFLLFILFSLKLFTIEYIMSHNNRTWDARYWSVRNFTQGFRVFCVSVLLPDRDLSRLSFTSFWLNMLMIRHVNLLAVRAWTPTRIFDVAIALHHASLFFLRIEFE